MGANEPHALDAALRFAMRHAVRLSPGALARGMAACLLPASPPRGAVEPTHGTASRANDLPASGDQSATPAAHGAPPGTQGRAPRPSRRAPAQPAPAAPSSAVRAFVRGACAQLRHDAGGLSMAEAAWVIAACAALQHRDDAMLR